MTFVVHLVAAVAYYALLVFFLMLLARFVLDLVRVINRGWRPRGVGLVAAEAAYTVTDPPLRFFRRIIPPLRMGPIAFDFGWTLTFLLCLILMSVASAFRVV